MTKTYSAPGKVILLGEYAVLTGLPALVAAIPPRFQLRSSLLPQLDLERSRSPLGRLLECAKKKEWPELSFNFLDPHQGTGGFGASTAEFALAYFAYSDAMGTSSDWKSLLTLYRQLMSDEPLVPSGADLVAQWQGGVVHFNPLTSSCTDVSKFFDWSCVLVFSATQLKGRKVPTHEHLELLSKQGFPSSADHLLSSLATVTEQGVMALGRGSAEEFGKTLDSYAEILRQAGLEVKGAYEDRVALRPLPGVLGMKGAGALQSDALILVMQPGFLNRELVIKKAQQRGLVLVSDGIIPQEGIKKH